jgi:lysozyme family protein
MSAKYEPIPAAFADQNDMNDMNHNEKAQPAPSNEAPLTDTDDIKAAHFHQLSAFEKLWVSTQASALFCSFVLIIGGGGMYFTSDYVNCDNNSPYSRALMSGMYAMLLCMYAWLCAYRLRKTEQALNAPNTLSLEAKYRRRQRIPAFMASTAAAQYLAALTYGLTAYRTSRGPLDFNVVSVAAAIGL